MSILQDIASEEQKMEMTPMIDVTFLLLIFFMCTIKFKTLEGKLSAYLPKDVGTAQTKPDEEPKEKVEIRLTVLKAGNRVHPVDRTPWTGEGRFEFDATRVIQYQVGPRKTTDVDELATRLLTLHEQDPERDSTIDARKGVVYGDVVQVLDAAIAAEFKSITFVGSFED